jgi:two-component system sensor histidine kinase UhpB
LLIPMSISRGAKQGLLSSITGRAVLASSAVLALIFVLLVVTPITIHAPPRATELVILAVGLAAMVVINAIVVRQALAPLRSFADEMDHVDLRHPDRGRIDAASQTVELQTFAEAFNSMLDRLAAERRAGSRAALIAQERERRRIGRALHDEAGQTLTAVALEIERAGTDGPGPDQERMAALAAELHNTLDEIRRIARELRPEALDDLGLINALIALSSRVSQQGAVMVERRLADDLPPLSEELELVVYRVAQEALTNVIRHSHASQAVIELANDDGTITLKVSDNGQGMPAVPAGETIGIEGMRERALLVGGTLNIESRPGAGTTVSLKAPVGAG